jgi:hypothetical protein
MLFKSSSCMMDVTAASVKHRGRKTNTHNILLPEEREREQKKSHVPVIQSVSLSPIFFSIHWVCLDSEIRSTHSNTGIYIFKLLHHSKGHTWDSYNTSWFTTSMNDYDPILKEELILMIDSLLGFLFQLIDKHTHFSSMKNWSCLLLSV